MAAEKEVLQAVRTIKEYCDSMSEKSCYLCPVWRICDRCFIGIPDEWPDLVEGSGESDKKTNCSDCGNRNTPVCKYCKHDAEGGIKNGN